MFHNVQVLTFCFPFLTILSSYAAPGNIYMFNICYGTSFVLSADEIEDIIEDGEDLFAKLWGQECMLDLQCASVMVGDVSVQISVCDNQEGYEGMSAVIGSSNYFKIQYLSYIF